MFADINYLLYTQDQLSELKNSTMYKPDNQEFTLMKVVGQVWK